jgi:hypothetical protein
MVASSLALTFGLGCEGKTDAGDTEGDTETGIPVGSTSMGPVTNGTSTSAATSEGSTSAPADSSGTVGETEATTNVDPTGGGQPVDCGGTVYACGDGMDNDGDGLIDFGDPECTGPCDDDESSFQTGLPGDNMDCKQDCFFDGNSGQGDDGCNWDLRCDPENPGEFINCEYTGGSNCDNQPPNQEQDCIDFCEPYVPPGCDCFGCCEVHLDDGSSVWIFLNSHPDCALDNLAACTECSPQIEDCGNTCEPEMCELCFGEDELPPGCDDVSCPEDSMPCTVNEDCPGGYFCLLECCVLEPPG